MRATHVTSIAVVLLLLVQGLPYMHVCVVSAQPGRDPLNPERELEVGLVGEAANTTMAIEANATHFRIRLCANGTSTVANCTEGRELPTAFQTFGGTSTPGVPPGGAGGGRRPLLDDEAADAFAMNATMPADGNGTFPNATATAKNASVEGRELHLSPLDLQG